MHEFAWITILAACCSGQAQVGQANSWGGYERYGSYDRYEYRSSLPRRTYPVTVLPPQFRMTNPLPIKNFGSGEAVRRDLNSLDSNSPTLQSYRRAVEAMKRLPPDDPHSWIFQANIHGFPSVPNPDPTWGQCQHGNWWFFPWHRAYLYYFEKMVRRYADDPTFALPYWDYSDPRGRTLPAAFRDPASTLYDSTRKSAVNSGTDQLNPVFVVSGTNASRAYTTFADFGPVMTFGGRAMNALQHRGFPHGALESIPHDVIHAFVGGSMANVDLAARDPVFFVHHANIDRLWVEWLQLGRGRTNPNNEVWLNQQFTFFDENKQRVTIAVRDLLDITTLGYSYEMMENLPAPLERPASQTSTATLATVNNPGRTLEIQPITLTLALPEQTGIRSQESGARNQKLRINQQAVESKSSQTVLLMEGCHFNGPIDSVVAAFLNQPANIPPFPGNAYYAGCFTFFGNRHFHENLESQLDVTRNFKAIRETNPNLREITVTLVRLPSGVTPWEFRTPFTFNQISLLTSK